MTAPPDHAAAGLEAQLRPEIDRLRATADALATDVRERHRAAMKAQEVSDCTRAAALMPKVEQINKRCNQANRAWLELVVQVMNETCTRKQERRRAGEQYLPARLLQFARYDRLPHRTQIDAQHTKSIGDDQGPSIHITTALGTVGGRSRIP